MFCLFNVFSFTQCIISQFAIIAEPASAAESQPGFQRSLFDDVRLWVIGGVATTICVFVVALLIACLCLKRGSSQYKSTKQKFVHLFAPR